MIKVEGTVPSKSKTKPRAPTKFETHSVHCTALIKFQYPAPLSTGFSNSSSRRNRGKFSSTTKSASSCNISCWYILCGLTSTLSNFCQRCSLFRAREERHRVHSRFPSWHGAAPLSDHPLQSQNKPYRKVDPRRHHHLVVSVSVQCNNVHPVSFGESSSQQLGRYPRIQRCPGSCLWFPLYTVLFCNGALSSKVLQDV